MTGSNDGNDNNGNPDRKLSPTEAAIIEMMKKQSLESSRQQQAANGGKGGEQKKHAFWDTQVSHGVSGGCRAHRDSQ